MNDSTHPAGSEEFLSRLHDGELSPAERGAFESHSASCPACREAVAQFERSLAAFRTAPTATVPSDLSARILRKIRAQSPARRPFGVMFGIDIRWAGVFMAALLVAIIAPALLFRHEIPGTVRSPNPISAYVVDSEPRDAGALQERGRVADRNAAKAPEAKPRANAEGHRQDAQRQAASASAPEQTAADEFAQRAPAVPPLIAREAERSAPSAASQRPATRAEKLGGEAAAAGSEESGAGDKVHLEIRALDGGGEPPPLAQAPLDGRLSTLRGREFVLIVEADGNVRGVAPARRSEGSTLQKKDVAADASSSADSASDLLRGLRFEPSGRPRRLLVRVE